MGLLLQGLTIVVICESCIVEIINITKSLRGLRRQGDRQTDMDVNQLEGLTVGLIRHLGDLNQFVHGHIRELWLCSAYVTREGVAAIADLLASAEEVHAIFGAGPLTDPEALRVLQQRGAAVGLVLHSPGAEVHPKCYIGIRADGQAWAAVGSANLTGGGAGANVELLVTITGSRSHPFMADLRDWLQEIESFSAPLTPDFLQALHQVHTAHVQAAPVADAAQADLLSALGESVSAAREEGGATVPRSITATAAELARRLHEEALVHYI